MSNGLYDALRDAGLDLLRAHRLDAYLRVAGGEDWTEHVARSLRGDTVDDGELAALRATLAADLDAITTGLRLLAQPPLPAHPPLLEEIQGHG